MTRIKTSNCFTCTYHTEIGVVPRLHNSREPKTGSVRISPRFPAYPRHRRDNTMDHYQSHLHNQITLKWFFWLFVLATGERFVLICSQSLPNNVGPSCATTSRSNFSDWLFIFTVTLTHPRGVIFSPE